MPIVVLEPLAKALNTTVAYLLGIEDEISASANKLDDESKKFVLEFINKLSDKK
jgi:DNA-dependent RNA polymerase auxiliary subunit epsilon